LAVIESPEVDQQLAQARATLEQARAAEAQAQSNLVQARAGVNQASANIVQARANEEIAATTNDRWTRLVGRGVLPKQAGDERRTTLAARAAETQAALAASKTADAIVVSRQADVTAAEAAIQAQAANVRRLEQQQEFERVIAPFNGVVSERKIERGDLVSADAGGDRNLFTVVQGNVLRIKVSVPQTYAIDLHPGQLAEVTVTERPGRRFEGKVARTAEALDASSRTLLTEVQVNNSSGDLLPGMYSQVKFSLTRVHATILVPANALLANSQGTRVVVVSEDGRAHFVPVQVGRDLGTDVEIVAGLKGTERLITNPADTLTEGQALRVQSDTPKEKKG
jgi:RND family efflux transporter MFP subunit